jgi:hypothetical protein
MKRSGEGVVRNLRAAAAALRERERAERAARA